MHPGVLAQGADSSQAARTLLTCENSIKFRSCVKAVNLIEPDGDRARRHAESPRGDGRALTIQALPAGMPAPATLGDRGMMAEGSPVKVMREGYTLPGG